MKNIISVTDCNSISEAKLIISNYYRYYEAFALSGVVEHHKGSVNWIIPKAGENGPYLAFNIKLAIENSTKEIQNLIKGIKQGTVPKDWFITPDSTPTNIMEILAGNGFYDLSANAPNPEPAMLLYRDDFNPCYFENNVVCRKITDKEDFKKWIKVVNTALHGWDMIDDENYYTWIENNNFSFYLGEIDGIPVSTAATIKNSNTASLEFVSTLKEYQRRGVASVVTTKAIAELFDSGVSSVTLSGGEEALPLYQKLGFHRCFNNIIMRYEA